MLQRRLSQPFDCRVRPDVHDSSEIKEFSSWLDRRFRLSSSDNLWSRSRSAQPSKSSHPTSIISFWRSEKSGAASPAWPSKLDLNPDLVNPSWPPSSAEVSQPPGGVVQLRRRCTTECHAGSRASLGLQSRIDAIRDFWGFYISFEVPMSAYRDHCAVERTFFAYLRTSVALSMSGVLFAQLLIIQHTPDPSPTFGFHVTGVPIACACQVAAIIVSIYGAWSSWIQQEAVMRGKIRTGGWGMVGLGIGFMTGTVILFVLTVAIGVDKGKGINH